MCTFKHPGESLRGPTLRNQRDTHTSHRVVDHHLEPRHTKSRQVGTFSQHFSMQKEVTLQGKRVRMRTTPRDGRLRDDTVTLASEWSSRGYQIFSWGWSSGGLSNLARGVLIAIREGTFRAGQIVQRYDPPTSLAGRMTGIRVTNWQTDSVLTNLAGYAPQETGPSEHKEHFGDHVTETLAKLPRRTLILFGGDFNGDPTWAMRRRARH